MKRPKGDQLLPNFYSLIYCDGFSFDRYRSSRFSMFVFLPTIGSRSFSSCRAIDFCGYCIWNIVGLKLEWIWQRVAGSSLSQFPRHFGYNYRSTKRREMMTITCHHRQKSANIFVINRETKKRRYWWIGELFVCILIILIVVKIKN